MIRPGLKKWFLVLTVVIAIATVVGYIKLAVVLLGESSIGQKVIWFLFATTVTAGLIAVSAAWRRLTQWTQTVTKQLEAIQPNAMTEVSDSDSAEDILDRCLTMVREELETLRSERERSTAAKCVAQNRQQRLEAVLHAMPDPVIVADSLDRVVLANPQAEKMFSFDLPDGSPKPLEACIRDRSLLQIFHEVKQSQSQRETEYTPDGDENQTYGVLVSPLPGLAGTDDPSQGFLAVLRDISEERETRKVKSDFVANASHELRTPLASIKAYLEMLIDGEVNDDKAREDFYQVMQNEVNRLSDLVESILDISRIEAGVVKVKKTSVPLTVIIKEVLEVLRPAAQAAKIRIIDELAPIFFHVRVDQEMIRQAVLNLVSNALKYTSENGSVTVRTIVDEVGGTVTLEVEDTGVGIAPEDLPRVFDKFYRVADSKKMAKGTGLGLVLVKEIIETVHSGTVNVTSTPGKGSTFRFTLPLDT